MEFPGSPTNQIWFQTDEAWDFLAVEDDPGITKIDVGEEARALRFITSAAKIEAFAAKYAAEFRPFTLFGSGDFHHLSALWTRQFTEPFSIISFDNHPDWDIRPPRWSCGAWVNRALENPPVEGIAIWGCGSFECHFPARLLGNRRAAEAGRLLVHPWKQKGRNYPSWLHPVQEATWKDDFERELERHAGGRIYVTIDLDCLRPEEAFTNWEQGRFSMDDVVWALGAIRKKAQIMGGDLCGAWSPPVYQLSFQKWAGWFDHPKVAEPDRKLRTVRHRDLFRRLWPALTGQPGE
jgi:arginase family enzyme